MKFLKVFWFSNLLPKCVCELIILRYIWYTFFQKNNKKIFQMYSDNIVKYILVSLWFIFFKKNGNIAFSFISGRVCHALYWLSCLLYYIRWQIFLFPKFASLWKYSYIQWKSDFPCLYGIILVLYAVASSVE